MQVIEWKCFNLGKGMAGEGIAEIVRLDKMLEACCAPCGDKEDAAIAAERSKAMHVLLRPLLVAQARISAVMVYCTLTMPCVLCVREPHVVGLFLSPGATC